jgi:hypothetical protein
VKSTVKNTKRTRHTYAAWSFDKEIADLNAQSENGWQLTEGGAFSQKFRRDDSVVYRYALDFNPNIEDKILYRATFAEQGWEYISSTFNGWHYFRKLYDPSLPETEYVIYTDSASDMEMKTRWLTIMKIMRNTMVLLILVMLVRMIIAPGIGTALMLSSFAVFLIVFSSAGKKILSAASDGSEAIKKRRGMSFMIVVFIFLSLSLMFSSTKIWVNSDNEYHAAISYSEWSNTPFEDVIDAQNPNLDIQTPTSPWVLSIGVRMPDLYVLSLEADATAEVNIQVTDENGNIVRSYKGDKIKEKQLLFLLPGEYTITTFFSEGVPLDSVGKMQYKLS